MNPNADHEHLLEDVLATGAEPLREAFFAETLRLARRRRRVRQLRWVAPVILLALASLWLGGWPPHARAPKTPFRGYELVSTRAFPAAAVLETRALPSNQWLVSAPNAMAIETANTTREFREIDDNELLVLAGSGTAALVRYRPHEAELVLLAPQTLTEGAEN